VVPFWDTYRVLWIRIRIKLKGMIRIRGPDPHQSDKLDADPHQFADDSQNVWNMSLFEHFFKVLSLYLEAKIRVRIKVKARFWIHIKVISRIRIEVMRIRNTEYSLGAPFSIS
jgi:hypothetical protein